MYRGSPLPPKSDPKAAEKMKEEAKKRQNENAERIAAIALGLDPQKAKALAEAKPVVLVEERRSREEEAADAALDAAELDEDEDE